MPLEFNMNETNIASYFLVHEVFDNLVMQLNGLVLSQTQISIMLQRFNDVQTFRDAFALNNWSFENFTMSVPAFFVITDLVFGYDAQVRNILRIADNMKDLKNGVVSGLTQRQKDLRWEILGRQLTRTRNGLIHSTNELITVIFDILHYQL